MWLSSKMYPSYYLNSFHYQVQLLFFAGYEAQTP